MTTEKTSSPRRSGADWFGLVAFAVLVICSAVLVVRLISTKFLPTGQLLLAVGALLVLSGLHGWVQLPHREKTGGKIACGIVALVLAAAMLYGAVALGSVQHAITDVADKSVETDITCVIVNADDPAQSLDDVKGYRFGILEDRDTENTQSLLQQLQEKLGVAYLFIAHDLLVVHHISDRIAVMYLGRIVEIADSNELNDNPMHPYTQSLLSAVPYPDPKMAKERQRIVLEGDVPSPLHMPSGCAFRTRCRYATEKCAQECPSLTDRGNGHQVACWNK